MTAPKSGESGLLELIREAYDLYQVEVVTHGKLYERYSEDFIYSHEFHDAIDAWSKNEHQKNFHILESLLLKRRDLIDRFFNLKDLTDEELKDLLFQFNTTLPSPDKHIHPRPRKLQSTRSFCSIIKYEDMDSLSDACNKATLFKETIDADDLYSLLEGKLESPLHARNNRLVAFFFDQLSISSLIIRNWQIVLSANQTILGSTGKHYLNQKALSSALYAISGWEMSAQEKALSEVISVISKKYRQIGNSNKKEKIKDCD